jgi:periplasmic copper chaperone A
MLTNAGRLLALAAICASAAPAAAHVVLEPRSAPAGSYAKAVFTVGHGCDGAATVGSQVHLPPGITSARPQARPGWTVTIEKEPLPSGSEAQSHGKQLTERIARITWRGGPLPDDQFEDFTILVQLPRDAGRRWFRVLQTCTQGVRDWAEVPGPNQSPRDLKSPALPLEVVPR